MRFDLDHDWHGSISTPSATMGERAKNKLLIVLCAIWLIFGLIGHSPWKPFESESISIIKQVIVDSEWLTPTAASQQVFENPPLYYIAAGLFAKLTSPLLSMHDAARFSSGLWMLATLMLIGLTGREMWGKGYGRQTVFIFIGSLGLVLSAHTITPHVSSLAGLAAGFYGLSLLHRRPYRAAILLGLGGGISFLSKGLIPAYILLITASILVLGFNQQWLPQRTKVTFPFALLIAVLVAALWLLPMQQNLPTTLYGWWHAQYDLFNFNQHRYLYFIKTAFWFCWPATPLALWGLWRYRKQLFANAHYQLIVVFFLVAFLMIGITSEKKDIHALPLLIPLTLLAGGCIETLKRGAAAALNWFGLMLYGLVIGFMWLTWSTMSTGWPTKLKERLTFLSGMTSLETSWYCIAISAFVTLIWLLAIVRSQHSNRAAATNWAIGMTAIWTILMTLWLPMIDSARSYEPVFTNLKAAIQSPYDCINSYSLGSAQQDFLDYYADIKTKPIVNAQSASCALFLIQDRRRTTKLILNDDDWQLIYEGKRISDRRENYRLYQKRKAN